MTGPPDDPLQRHQEALLRFPSGVLSHETALDLHGLCEIDTDAVHVTVPRRLRARGQVPAWLTVHRADLGADDIATHQGLAIVTPARAIVDAIHAGVGGHLVDEAVQTARRRDLLAGPERLAIERALLTERLRQIDRIAP